MVNNNHFSSTNDLLDSSNHLPKSTSFNNLNGLGSYDLNEKKNLSTNDVTQRHSLMDKKKEKWTQDKRKIN